MSHYNAHREPAIAKHTERLSLMSFYAICREISVDAYGQPYDASPAGKAKAIRYAAIYAAIQDEKKDK